MTQIGRRGFLGLLGASVAATAAQLELDPERALWVPGQKTIFLPPETPRLATQDEVAFYQDGKVHPLRYRMDIADGEDIVAMHFTDGWRYVHATRNGVRIKSDPRSMAILEAELGAKIQDFARVGSSKEHGISLEERGTPWSKRHSYQRDLTDLARRASIIKLDHGRARRS